MARFTEEDAQRIFARAAERQHASNDDAPGFSLEELQEIGRAAGLGPEHISAAIAEVRGASLPPRDAPTFWGAATSVRRSRVLPVLTDEAWQGAVSRLRKAFKTTGLATEVGRMREWTGTNSTGGLSNLHVVAEPTEGGTRVTLETSRAEEARQSKQLALWLPLGMLGFFAVMGAVEGAYSKPSFWAIMASIAFLGALIPAISRSIYARWSARREGEFDTLLDQFELLARNTSPVSSPPLDASPLEGETAASKTGTLDLGALDDAPDTATRNGGRRSRS